MRCITLLRISRAVLWDASDDAKWNTARVLNAQR
jgi:hypothetical protein